MKNLWSHLRRPNSRPRKTTRPTRRQTGRAALAQRLQLEMLEDRRLLAGDITGTVFDDANANGIDDPSENGLPGWTVFIDANGDGQLNLGEVSTTTDSRGRYALLGLPAGSTTICEIPQEPYSPTPGFTDHQTVTVRDGKETRVKFPNVTTPVTSGQINGTVYEDSNESLTKDSGEHGLSGWTMFLDTNGDGALTAGEPTAVTDADGDYLFADIPAGSYPLFEIPQGGYQPIVGGLFPTTGASTFQSVTVVLGSSVRRDFANLIPPVGTIQGGVWHDADGDGTRDATEVPLAGQTVFVDLDGNGSPTAGEPLRVTDAAGAYSFNGIHTGSYLVTNVMPSGWISAIGRPAVRSVTVFRGGVSATDFYELVPTTGSVTGTVWDDADGNGVRGAAETGLAGWSVFLDQNANGAADASEPQMITDGAGAYYFDGVPYGTNTVRVLPAPTWFGTNPSTGALSLLLLNGENRTGADLGFRERVGTIQGTIWNDLNGDGVRAASDLGLADRVVFLDLNANGVTDSGEPTVVSDAAGTFRFQRVPAGSYTVQSVVPDGWVTAIGKSAAASATVTTGSVNNVNFFEVLPVTGTVSGVVFNDLDSNGTQAATEVGLAGWQLFVDLNGNATLDAGEPQTLSDATGAYTLTNVPYGNNTIRELVRAGFTATNRALGVASLLVLNGENKLGVHFGNHELTDFIIQGSAFFDADHDGLRGPSERGLSGLKVYLDTNDNGALDVGEPTAITSNDLFFTPAVDESGRYAFTHLARGTYTVREIVPVELGATPADHLVTTVTIGPTNASDVNFADWFRTNEIHGVVFDDTDADHVRDPGEYSRPGVTVYLDLDRDDVYDVDEPQSVTGDDGAYAFVGLTPGAYIVRELSGAAGPHTYPQTGGGILWPTGTDHLAIGNVSPGSLTQSLTSGEHWAQTVSLTLPAGGGISNMVDVFLLFDDTGSFTGNSPIVRAAFPEIIASLQSSLPGVDLGFGVGRFEEYGSFASEFATGRPFILNQPIVASSTTGFASSIQSALDRMAPGYGGDGPETDIEALFQVVTGLGFDGNNNGTTTDSGAAGLAATQLTPGNSGDVPSFASFAADPANQVLPAAGNLGGAGFRPGALPIILTATDTGFAYQPKGETSVVGAGGLTLPVSTLTEMSRASTPFSSGAGLQETITGLNALGALVIGLGTNPEASLAPRSSLEALARLTGAVNQSTSTIANGTIDPIAPGDPLYFQISSGFGTTVADGVINAIQNAVTNVAVDITLRASDPRVQIINHTGTVAGVGAGQTATFDIEFVGDGRPHRFDLQFVRVGTNVVLGSIPVVLGTPVVGEGYSYDELEDGEIHQSSHFGNYVANVAPSFTVGPDVVVAEDAGLQSLSWASAISAGPANEAAQTVNFLVTTDRPDLFSLPPTIAADGTLTFTPAPNAFGTATVNVRLHDNGGAGLSGTDTSVPQVFTIQLTPVSDAPVATDDAYETRAGADLVIAPAGVLANDFDVDGDPLTAVLVSGPAHGTLSLQADGSFVYRSAAGYQGTDSFSYLAQDGTADSPAAIVTLTVLAGNTAPVALDDTYATTEDAPLSISGPGLLGNDSDVDGDPLAASLVAGPSLGTVTLQPDGSFVYVPAANASGNDQFTYQVSDGSLTSLVATVTVEIAPVNDAPLSVDDTYAAAEDTLLTVSVPGVLSNDSDIDGNPLRAILVSGPSHGTLVLNANGSFTYSPAANYHGPDSFRYQANDGFVDSPIATVQLTVASVNDVPVAVGDSYSLTQNATLNVAARGVLLNDSDADGDTLTAILGTAPAHGVVTLRADGSLTYTPATNYSGPDSFTYRASDGVALSALTTVSLTVTPPAPKFFVVDDGSKAMFRYGADGGAQGNNALNKSDSKPRGVASNATGTTQWVIDGSGTIFIYDQAANLLGQWQPQNVGKPEGVTVWGNDLWLVDPTQDRVFFFSGGAAVRSGRVNATSSFALNGGNLNATDLVTDGVHLWVVNDTATSDAVFRYTTSGALEGSWILGTNNPSPTGITLDPTLVNHLWIIDASTDKIYQYDGATSRLVGSQLASTTFALAATNGSPQGIADPLVTPAAATPPSVERDEAFRRRAERAELRHGELESGDDRGRGGRHASRLAAVDQVWSLDPAATSAVNDDEWLTTSRRGRAAQRPHATDDSLDWVHAHDAWFTHESHGDDA